MPVDTLLDQLKAEQRLEGSHVLTQIKNFQQSLAQPSEGRYLSFDDYFRELQELVDGIPRIQLQDRIAPQQETTYIIQLVEALDQVQDKITVVQNRSFRLQARLIEAKSQIDALRGAFETWYSIAVNEFLKASGAPKLTPSTVRSLAVSEFHRLMGNAPVVVETLIEAVKAEQRRLDAKKKMAREKFDLGREQVDAAYANRLPPILGHSSHPSMRLVQEPEEELDQAPAFISRRQTIAVVEDVAEPEPTPEPTEPEVKKPAFYKTSPPVEARPISDQEVLEQYLKKPDAQTEPASDVIPKVADDMPPPQAKVPPPSKGLSIVTSTPLDDELDALTSKPIDQKRSAVAVAPPPRRSLVFNYSDDLA